MVIQYLNFKNMKRLIFILLFAVTTFCVTSCYDDKGNYNYTDLNSVEITGIEDEYTVEQFENLTITPELTMRVNSDESLFEFDWNLYDSEDREVDTISRERNLDVAIGVAPKTYTVIYKVTNKETGVFYKYTFRLKVINSFSDGLMVLSELEGKANVAFLNSADKMYEDVYYAVNGEYVGEKPVGLGYMHNRYSQAVLIMVGDGSGGVITDRLGFIKIQEYKDLFWIAPENPNPKAFFTRTQSEDIIIENGEVYSRNYMMPAPHKYGAAQMTGTDLFPASFTAGFQDRAFYDNNGEKFIIKGAWSTSDVVSMPDSIYNPADLKMQMICGGDGFKSNGFGLFYDDDANEYYSLSFTYGRGSIVPLRKVLVSSATDIEKANTFAVSTLSPQYFYAVDNKVYCLDALSDVTKLVYTFDAGLTIDYIELEGKKFDKVMYVGTSTEGTGKTGSFHIMDVSSNGNMELRDSYNNVAGKIVDFLYKEVY